jgi:holin-like protein
MEKLRFMKIMLQIAVIFGLCWISQIIARFLPFDFPASIIALFLVFFMLLAGLLKPAHIREKSDFLLSHMAFFLIPSSVNVMNYLGIIKENVLKLVLVCVLSMVVTFGVTALTVRVVLKLMRKFSGPSAGGS